MESISIEFPRVHPSLTKNGRRRSHWRTQRKATEEMRDDANFLIIKEMMKAEISPRDYREAPLFSRAKIDIHQDWANNPLDYDGLASAVAPAIDAFIDKGIIQDDSPRFIESYNLTSSKVPKQNMNRIQITVSEA